MYAVFRPVGGLPAFLVRSTGGAVRGDPTVAQADPISDTKSPIILWVLGPLGRCGRIISLGHCGEPVERGLKLVIGGRLRTSKALLVRQL